MNGHRVLTPNDIGDISKKLSLSRGEFLNRFEKAMGDTVKFAQDVSAAIGEISVAEAEAGVIDYFSDRMKDLL